MKYFEEWLIERDPNLAEAFGIQTMKKGAKWLGRKGLPFAMQAGMSVSDPASFIANNGNLTAPDKHQVVDDYFTREAERRRGRQETDRENALKNNQAVGGGKFQSKI